MILKHVRKQDQQPVNLYSAKLVGFQKQGDNNKTLNHFDSLVFNLILDEIFCCCLFMKLDCIVFHMKKVCNWQYVKRLAGCLKLVNGCRSGTGWSQPDLVRVRARSCRVGSGSGMKKSTSPGPSGKKNNHAVLYY